MGYEGFFCVAIIASLVVEYYYFATAPQYPSLPLVSPCQPSLLATCINSPHALLVVDVDGEKVSFLRSASWMERRRCRLG
jgi:hypothetical protein